VKFVSYHARVKESFWDAEPVGPKILVVPSREFIVNCGNVCYNLVIIGCFQNLKSCCLRKIQLFALLENLNHFSLSYLEILDYFFDHAVVPVLGDLRHVLSLGPFGLFLLFRHFFCGYQIRWRKVNIIFLKPQTIID
jgi:hypothetical protein